MRVISMVPSWTETLIAANVNVVGRTRFCIHPKDQVANISVIGGTKDWDLEKIKALKPDLVLLDQEENPKFMSEQTDIQWVSTHVTSINDMPRELEKLSQVLSNPKLKDLSQKWNAVCAKPNLISKEIPGIIEWGKVPASNPKNILYMIWKNPWMAVSRGTFIGSVCEKIGLILDLFPAKYPEVDLSQFNPEETLILFSSEPYPFLKKKNDFAGFEFPHAFVDGENFSWFGVRSLEFLEKTLSTN